MSWKELSNKNWGRIAAVVLMINLVMVAGVASIEYLQQNQTISSKNQTISSENARIASLFSSITSQIQVISGDNSTISQNQATISSLQAIINLQDSETLVLTRDYSISQSQTISLGNYSLPYGGAVIFYYYFVAFAGPLQICSYQNMSTTGHAGQTLNLASANACPGQSVYDLSAPPAVYVGWFPVTAGIFHLSATDNTTYSGTLILTATLLY